MKHLLLVLATAYLQSSPSESQWISTKRWEDFRPTNHNNWPDGWKVRSEESEDNRYRFTFELAHPQASDLNDHNYVLWVNLYRSTNDTTQQLGHDLAKLIVKTFGGANVPERATKEEQRVKGNPFFPDLSSIPAFDPTWQLRGLKVVNLYAQLVSQVSWGRNGLYLSKMNPSDPVEQQNTVSDKILQCQNDRRCKAIVAAWGRVP